MVRYTRRFYGKNCLQNSRFIAARCNRRPTGRVNEYRGVLRVNAYHYYVKQAKQAGGCATYRTNEKEKELFLLLLSLKITQSKVIHF